MFLISRCGVKPVICGTGPFTGYHAGADGVLRRTGVAKKPAFGRCFGTGENCPAGAPGRFLRVWNLDRYLDGRIVVGKSRTDTQPATGYQADTAKDRIHRFETVSGKKVRLTVYATNGDPSARVFQIRVYRE